MKKLILFSGVFALIFIFGSCKKNPSDECCTCVETISGTEEYEYCGSSEDVDNYIHNKVKNNGSGVYWECSRN